MKRVLNLITDILIALLIAAIIVSFYFVLTSKQGKATPFFMYRVYINKVDHMAPTIEYGDMVVGKIVDAKDLKENDIVIYYNESIKTSFASRIQKINDNNTVVVESDNVSSEETIKTSQIDGKFMIRLHLVGLILAFFTTPRGTVVLVLLLILLIIIGVIINILRTERRKDKDEAKKNKENKKNKEKVEVVKK